MNTSDQINEVAGALATASTQFKPIVKDKWNPHFKSHYADLASVRDAVIPALAANGLVLVQTPDSEGEVVRVETRIVHKSGQRIGGTLKALAKNGGAQQVGGAITYLSRYAITSMLNLPVGGEDNDGNETQKEEPAPSSRDPIANPQNVFDFETMQHELAAELKRRNVPEEKWEAVGKWLHGKDKGQISKAIASA